MSIGYVAIKEIQAKKEAEAKAAKKTTKKATKKEEVID